MKYNGFYYFLFQGTMKRVIEAHYGKAYARDVMRKSKTVYRKIVDNVMIHLQQGVLHREHMIADGGNYCDYYIVGDKEHK